jgi:hypothetical protein
MQTGLDGTGELLPEQSTNVTTHGVDLTIWAGSEPLVQDAYRDQPLIDHMVKAVALGRAGTAEDDVRRIVSLASEAVSHLVSQTISVSDGLTMTS